MNDPIARKIDETDQRSVELINHVHDCEHCDPSQKDPNWQVGLCPVGRSIATGWRRAESDFLEEVFKLDLDGDVGNQDGCRPQA